MGEQARRWLLSTYAPVTLFSLRPSTTTAAGGQTLLVPTPYAVKLALTDAGIRTWGTEAGRRLFGTLQPLEVRFRPPTYSVVTNTFNRVRWLARGESSGARNPSDSDEEDDADSGGPPPSAGPWASRIAYREYCYHLGSLQIAWRVEELSGEEFEQLRAACSLVTYFGKRGSFFQFLETSTAPDLPAGFDETADPPPLDLNYALVQLLDDMPREPRPDLWDRVSSFSASRVRLNEDRLLRGRARLLPMRRLRSARAFTLYGRTI